jgi:two-component system phosphate regulon response regulator PhoB
MSALILIVEDEEDLVETLSYKLVQDGFETRTALSGHEAMAEVSRKPHPDLVLLDLMLPDFSGTEVCRRIRENPELADVPVMMLTAKDDEIDRVVGFEVGADDYVVKPFSVRELILRIRAVLRRSRSDEPSAENNQEPADEKKETLEFEKLRVDVPAHRVAYAGEKIELTALEFRLLATFMRRRGRVQTREILLSDVWDVHANVRTRTVDTHVKRLREKLGDAGRFIETVRGVGYRFLAKPQ